MQPQQYPAYPANNPWVPGPQQQQPAQPQFFVPQQVRQVVLQCCWTLCGMIEPPWRYRNERCATPAGPPPRRSATWGRRRPRRQRRSGRPGCLWRRPHGPLPHRRRGQHAAAAGPVLPAARAGIHAGRPQPPAPGTALNCCADNAGAPACPVSVRQCACLAPHALLCCAFLQSKMGFLSGGSLHYHFSITPEYGGCCHASPARLAGWLAARLTAGLRACAAAVKLASCPRIPPAAAPCMCLPAGRQPLHPAAHVPLSPPCSALQAAHAGGPLPQEVELCAACGAGACRGD